MASTKILIVEDEILIAEDIAGKLVNAGYEVTGTVDNCDDALQSVNSNPPDLIFLDINIAGDKDGIETAIELRKIDNFLLIFLTHLDDEKTVRRAMEQKPANYLSKPFTEQQLHISIQTALLNIAENKTASFNGGEETEIGNVALPNKLFLRDKNGAFQKYDIDDILYIEADRAYCNIHTKKGSLTQATNMNAMNEKMNHRKLVRVHRSYIVNIENIDSVKGNTLIIEKNEIPVSEQYKDSVFKQLRLVR